MALLGRGVSERVWRANEPDTSEDGHGDQRRNQSKPAIGSKQRRSTGPGNRSCRFRKSRYSRRRNVAMTKLTTPRLDAEAKLNQGRGGNGNEHTYTRDQRRPHRSKRQRDN